MERFLLVCLGGAAGTGVRYLISLWAGHRLGSSFPAGTLIVNVVGCFLIALIMQLALSASWSHNLRITLTSGFLGGLTTYSAFNYETTRLLQEGATRTAVLNIGVTTIGCFVAGLGGLVVARQLVGAGSG